MSEISLDVFENFDFQEKIGIIYSSMVQVVSCYQDKIFTWDVAGEYFLKYFNLVWGLKTSDKYQIFDKEVLLRSIFLIPLNKDSLDDYIIILRSYACSSGRWLRFPDLEYPT